MNLELSKEQLTDIQAAIVYYMQRHISIKNPRYDEYEVILQMLSKSIRNLSLIHISEPTRPY